MDSAARMSQTIPSLARTPGRARPSLEARLDAVWSPAVARGLVGAGLAIALLVFAVRQTYPNYDTYYTLVWGQELAAGRLPDYAVLRTPTPHPLAMLAGWALAPFGTASDRLLVLAALLGFVGFLVVMYTLCRRLLGRAIALLAVAVLLTRTDMLLLALRAMFDLPFYALVFGAAALEVRRSRAGAPVLALLCLAGLLRPEAWVLAGAYWLWLVPATPRPALVRLGLLVAAAPVLWMAWDTIVTGEPLYSLTSTREVSGEFGRNRGIGDAIVQLPTYAGGNDRATVTGVGGLGLGLAGYLLRGRAAVPAAMGVLGVLTFFVIAAAGLSVIPRYLTVPSLLLSCGIAVALLGWTRVQARRPRRVAIGIALLSVALLAWRGPALAADVGRLDDQTRFVAAQHGQLDAILDAPAVVPALAACRPITVPTHSAIPVIRYETGLPKTALQATIGQDRAPRAGLLLVGRTFNFEPSAARATSVPTRSSSRRPWSNRALPGFTRIARTARWSVHARCPGARPTAPGPYPGSER